MAKIERNLLHFWWVALFLIGCLLFFEQGEKGREILYTELSERLQALEQEESAALVQREDLLLQINSQSDPRYVELILMKELGVVPEGSQKVYFAEKTH